jgi:hypothetical protein
VKRRRVANHGLRTQIDTQAADDPHHGRAHGAHRGNTKATAALLCDLPPEPALGSSASGSIPVLVRSSSASRTSPMACHRLRGSLRRHFSMMAALRGRCGSVPAITAARMSDVNSPEYRCLPTDHLCMTTPNAQISERRSAGLPEILGPGIRRSSRIMPTCVAPIVRVGELLTSADIAERA